MASPVREEKEDTISNSSPNVGDSKDREADPVKPVLPPQDSTGKVLNNNSPFNPLKEPFDLNSNVMELDFGLSVPAETSQMKLLTLKPQPTSEVDGSSKNSFYVPCTSNALLTKPSKNWKRRAKSTQTTGSVLDGFSRERKMKEEDCLTYSAAKRMKRDLSLPILLQNPRESSVELPEQLCREP